MSTAALVMAYGTPSSPEDVERFYTDIRRGRPPTSEQLAELCARYDAIGGISPMNARTAAQLDALQRGLDEVRGGEFRTFYGAKHADPSIEQAVISARAAGCDRLVGLVLAPHYSAMSVGEYLERAAEQAETLGLPAAFVKRWFDEPALVEALATRVKDALERLDASTRDGAVVVFSAHSLPARILETSDPYPHELAESARLVAEQAGIARFCTAWQSAGRTGEAWLGPDISAVIDQLADEHVPAVVSCPIGFTSDHLEVLYDLDLVAKHHASERGLAFVRCASLNDEPAVFAALARRLVALADSLS